MSGKPILVAHAHNKVFVHFFVDLKRWQIEVAAFTRKSVPLRDLAMCLGTFLQLLWTFTLCKSGQKGEILRANSWYIFTYGIWLVSFQQGPLFQDLRFQAADEKVLKPKTPSPKTINIVNIFFFGFFKYNIILRNLTDYILTVLHISIVVQNFKLDFKKMLFENILPETPITVRLDRSQRIQ